MHNIKIETIEINCFKGLRAFKANFNDGLTTISGRNGLGKTTVFDAFTWLLFGKNSQGATSFNIKTLDKDGNVIQKMPHEVSATISVDGTTVSLRRIYKEKWVKKTGSPVETFEGNKEEYFYNDVPLSQKEYKAKVAEFCKEETFRLLTDPYYLTSLTWDKQREILFDVAGDVTDTEIANGNKDFETLLNNITGKTLDEYKREVANKKKRIKTEVDNIPARIDECNRAMPESANWNEIGMSIKAKQERITEVQNMLNSMLSAQDHIASQRRALIDEISSIYQKRVALGSKITFEANAEYNTLNEKKNAVNRKIMSTKDIIAKTERTKEMLLDEYNTLSEKRNNLLKEYDDIKTSKLVVGESAFTCQTCGRMYAEEEVAEIRERLLCAFNAKKADKLADNKSKGIANKEAMSEISKKIKSIDETIAEYKKELETLQSDHALNATITLQDTAMLLDKNEEYQSLLEKERKLQQEADRPIKSGFDAEERQRLNEECYRLQQEVKELERTLANKGIITNLRERVKQLEGQLREQSQAIADLESIEFTIQEFSKARTTAMTDRVNGMFSLVSFRLFETLVNGSEKETCIATVNGVPYNDVNQAHKMLAGLDIVNGISKKLGIIAPVWCDSAESVNVLPEMNGQLIALKVTEEKELTVK